MRRLTTLVVAAGTALLFGSSPATADPSPAAPAPPPPGKKICAVTDPKLGEISGIVATQSGYLAVNAAVENEQPSHMKIFSISGSCKVSTKTIAYASAPHSPQDIVRAPDGTLWIEDTGDAKSRSSVALWKIGADLAGPAQIYRFSFPAEDKHDSRAMLVNGDGTPIIITFELGAALIYTPTSAPSAGGVVPLKKAGQISILPTVTENIFGGAGHKGFQGGAVSPDGSKVVLRTQADAYEWDVKSGDVLAALKTEPRVTGLPSEPISEAITYSSDGTKFITATRLDQAKSADPDVTQVLLLSYTPVKTSYVAPPVAKSATGDSALMKWFKSLSLKQAYLLLAGIGFIGIALVFVGVIGMAKGREKRAKAAAAAKKARKREREEALDALDNSETAVLAPVYGGYDDGGYGYSPPPPPAPSYNDGGYSDQGGWAPPPPPPPAPPQPRYSDPYSDPYGQPGQYGGPQQPDPWGGGRGY
jgi:hypothetical protein